MTTSWKPERLWEGETVAVVGGGPSFNPGLVDKLRGMRIIAVNNICRVIPDADMLVALDADWPEDYRAFKGVRVAGNHDETLDAFNVGHAYDEIKVGEHHVVHVRNSGLTALRIAAQMGAAKVVVLGFDPELPMTYFDGYYSPKVVLGEAPQYWQALQCGLINILDQMRAQGIDVVRMPPPETAVKSVAPATANDDEDSAE